MLRNIYFLKRRFVDCGFTECMHISSSVSQSTTTIIS